MRRLITELHQESFDIVEAARNGVPRAVAFAETDLVIKVAIGMRRVGKSFLLYQKMHALLDQGVTWEQILFLNFEDDRLRPMDAKTAGKLLDAFYELYPENHHRRCYFFLDEIHVVENWHLVARRFFDTKQVQLYLTGSSAKLLSTEIHTSLRGRSLATEVWPYSFSEYCAAHDILPPTKKLFGKATFDTLYQSFLTYLFLGGFPAVQHMQIGEWREMLQGYVDVVIMRDIVERYSVSNIAFLRYLVNTVLKNAATHFSVNKFYNDAKSVGYKVGKDTIHLYLRYLEDAFLCFSVPVYSKSARAINNQTKKIYAVDTGIIHAVSLSSEDLYGKLFENLVYLALRRQRKKIYFYKTKSGYEIDFVTVDPAGKKECIQVCWDVTDEATLDRENRALQPGILMTPREYLMARL